MSRFTVEATFPFVPALAPGSAFAAGFTDGRG
jgi:prepilin signal peptidase PulO-like enzyme (type II secretory pathway)